MSTPTNGCDYKEATGRHAWRPGGLDVRGDRLVSVRTCTACGAETVTRYTGPTKRRRRRN